MKVERTKAGLIPVPADLLPGSPKVGDTVIVFDIFEDMAFLGVVRKVTASTVLVVPEWEA